MATCPDDRVATLNCGSVTGMCTSKPPKVKPIPSAPTASPEIIDSTAYAEKDRYRQRARSRYGRQATIITGDQGAPAAAGKTLLGQ